MAEDICAYTNNVRVSTFSTATYESILAGVSSALIAGGWDVLPGGDYLSQQCPWFASSMYPPVAPPENYSGRVRVRLGRHSNGDLSITAGNADFSVHHSIPHRLLSKQTDLFPLFLGNGTISSNYYMMIVDPFQFIVYLYGMHDIFEHWDYQGCLVSSLQVPSFTQGESGVIDSIIAAPVGEFRYRSLVSYDPNVSNYFGLFDSVETGRIIKHSTDPPFPGQDRPQMGLLRYSVPKKFSYFVGDPLMSPPFVFWSLDASAPLIMGFLWDCIIMNTHATADASIELDGHTWLHFSNDSSLGTLTFVTGVAAV